MDINWTICYEPYAMNHIFELQIQIDCDGVGSKSPLRYEVE